MSENKKDTIYKLTTFKRLNENAKIFGYPFGIFFIVVIWIVINVFAVISVSFLMKIFFGILGFFGLIIITVVYKKYGLKASQKYIDLIFKKVKIIKCNEQIRIKKINLKDE